VNENGKSTRKMLSGFNGIHRKGSVTKKSLHLKYLINNLFHILQVGGEQAWDHVCIGSDFDGFIKPIDSCRNVAEYPQLYNDLVADLPEMYRALQQKNPDLRFNIDDPAAKIERLMHGNVVRFLKLHF
jgi:microsomal dipeptidase-like Zn-dependent dipeptidase